MPNLNTARRTRKLIYPVTLRFLACSIGGPAVVYAVSPTEEELFKRYNPDLQKKSLANRHEKQQAFDDYLTMLKKYSKSDKNSMCRWIRQEPAPTDN